jgi:hypothetical protein
LYELHNIRDGQSRYSRSCMASLYGGHGTSRITTRFGQPRGQPRLRHGRVSME